MQKDKKTNRKDIRISEMQERYKQAMDLYKLGGNLFPSQQFVFQPVVKPISPIRTPNEERMDMLKYPTTQPIPKPNLGLSSNKNMLFVVIGVGVIGAAYFYYKTKKK